MLLDTVLKVYVPTQAFCIYQTRQLIKRRDGASGIEYALIAAMVAVVLALFVTPLSGVVKSTFNNLVKGLGGTAVT